MALTLKGRKIARVGIIGSGQIGPDIALHFAETLLPFEVAVAVVDISQEALAAGRKKVDKKIGKLVEKGRMKADKGKAITSAISFGSDYAALAGADLVVEAATEDLAIKRKIFAQLAQSCGQDTVLTSNSSHLEPDVIFADVPNPARCAVTHYFYPAERNPVVEVAPGSKTDRAVTDFLMTFYELSGKFPVEVGGRYGYAIDPVFEGLFLAAAMVVEKSWASHEQVDAVCQKVLGQGVGPFTAMNLTGGNPLTNIGLAHYTDKIMPWFHSPPLLKQQLDKNEPWPMAGRDTKVEIDEGTERKVADWMTGAYFALTTEILDAGLTNVADYDQALPLALAMKSPFSMMNKMGTAAALKLVQSFAAQNDGVKVAGVLEKLGANNTPWEIPTVLREDRDGIAVITLRRFRVLNALSSKVMAEIDAMIDAVAADASVKGVVLRGFGNRAFVAGADIRELAATETVEAGIETARGGQRVTRKIEKLQKPVVAAMNGLAFGGGCELAMSCHARLAAAGLRVFAGQPEPNLGIIPGYGGSQRLPRLIGFEAAWKMLRDGLPIGSAEAKKLGLIRDEVPATELLDAAIALARDAADGKVELPKITEGPIAVPDKLPEVHIGHLSKRIDQIMMHVTLEGAKTTLDEGLELEAKGFGECLDTRDTRIGMKNFIENGPKAKAEFVHA